MDSHTDLQNPVQSPPQEQTQPISPPDGPSTATTPEVTGTQRTPPASDTNGIDARALKQQPVEDLRALRRVSFSRSLSLADSIPFTAKHLGTFRVSQSSPNGDRGKCHRLTHINHSISRHENSEGCCDAAVHRARWAGICGNQEDGAFSVVMSGVYEDVDEGDVMYECLPRS